MDRRLNRARVRIIVPSFFSSVIPTAGRNLLFERRVRQSLCRHVFGNGHSGPANAWQDNGRQTSGGIRYVPSTNSGTSRRWRACQAHTREPVILPLPSQQFPQVLAIGAAEQGLRPSPPCYTASSPRPDTAGRPVRCHSDTHAANLVLRVPSIAHVSNPLARRSRHSLRHPHRTPATRPTRLLRPAEEADRREGVEQLSNTV